MFQKLTWMQIFDGSGTHISTVRGADEAMATKIPRNSSRPRVSTQRQIHPAADRLFQIPRKPVGGARAFSVPTPKGNSSAAQIFSHLKRMSGSGKKAQRVPSPAFLGTENAAVGFHSYPPTSSTYRSTKCDRVLPAPTLKPLSNDQDPKGAHTYRKIYSLNDYVASCGNLPRSTIPDLGKGYRRPKVLLPTHLQQSWIPPHDASSYNANNKPTPTGASCDNSARMIPGQRPHMRRIPATTAIHKIDVIGQSLPRPLQEREITGHDESTVDIPWTPSQTNRESSGSTCAAGPAFLDVLDHKAAHQYQTAPGKPHPNGTLGSKPPSFALNGVLLADQNSGSDPRPEMQYEVQNTFPQSALAGTEKDPQHPRNLSRTIKRSRSRRDTNRIWASILAVVLEVLSLIDFDQVQRQIAKILGPGVLAARRMPWALGILKSRDATAAECLSAVRCLLVSSLYLVVLLSVFAAAIRMFELLVEIGRFLWFPVSVLVTATRWILNP